MYIHTRWNNIILKLISPLGPSFHSELFNSWLLRRMPFSTVALVPEVPQACVVRRGVSILADPLVSLNSSLSQWVDGSIVCKCQHELLYKRFAIPLKDIMSWFLRVLLIVSSSLRAYQGITRAFVLFAAIVSIEM